MHVLSMPVWLAVLQILQGYLLKRWPKFPNQAINLATYLLGLIGYAIVPKEANASTLTDVLVGPGNIFLWALAQQLGVTGVHSTWKNTVYPAFFNVLTALFPKKAPGA